MIDLLRAAFGLSVCVSFLTGCGSGSGDLKTARAGGVVTYKGAPIAGANVIFMPDKGPLAMAVTDLKGEFKLSMGALPGCAVGPAKVAVSIAGAEESSQGMPNFNAPPKTSAEFAERSKKMADATLTAQKVAAKPKSLIPSKYKETSTSGLSFTVNADNSKNNFAIKLED